MKTLFACHALQGCEDERWEFTPVLATLHTRSDFH
jgi:hypothetical protein